jgi:hypothetical protein
VSSCCVTVLARRQTGHGEATRGVSPNVTGTATRCAARPLEQSFAVGAIYSSCASPSSSPQVCHPPSGGKRTKFGNVKRFIRPPQQSRDAQC